MVQGKGPTLFFCTWLFSFSSTICWDCIFPHVIVLASLRTIHLIIDLRVCFWAFNSVQLVYVSILLPISYCQFACLVSIFGDYRDSSHFIILCQHFYIILDVFLFHVNYRLNYPMCMNNLASIVTDRVKPKDQFGENWHLYSDDSSNPWIQKDSIFLVFFKMSFISIL